MPPDNAPTDEQVAILKHLKETDDNVLINALAGTGKTTTLELMVQLWPTTPILYLAFNKAIVKEAEEKLPDNVEMRTCNSLGHRVWGKTVGNISFDTKKIPNILKEMINELEGDDKKEAREAYFDILSAVSMARHLGYIPDSKFPNAKRLTDVNGLNARLETPLTPFLQALVDAILFMSIKAAYKGFIDFDDQIYMSALFGGTFPRFPIVLIDEDQDWSPTNHAMLSGLVRGRLCAVGDRWQSIYYFRGAETNGVDRIKKKFNMTEKPLSMSFRCPKAIVEAVHWHVPHFRWSKDGGVYDQLPTLDAAEIPEGSAIICRNNAPLFRAAFGLLSEQRSVQVAGSDIGPKIIRLLQKIASPTDTREDLIFKIEAWKQEKLERTNAPATIHDTAECLKVFAEWGTTCDQAIRYAKHIFEQQGTIQLTTGHKAKGREWDRVYHLDPWLIGKDEQEFNLKYVITTRAKQELFEITTKDMSWLQQRQD